VVTTGEDVLSSNEIIINKPNTQRFTGHMPFLSPNQQCQSTDGKILHFTELTWGLPTLSVTTNSFWLPCGRVLISLLMQVPQFEAVYRA